ncbi:hypothetical protein DERF_005399, partial [Dermatophagoides farinae]
EKILEFQKKERKTFVLIINAIAVATTVTSIYVVSILDDCDDNEKYSRLRLNKCQSIDSLIVWTEKH